MTNLLLSKKIWIPVVSLLMIFGALYVFQVNDFTHDLYVRDQNRKRLAELQREIDHSTVAAFKNRSLTKVGGLVENMEFQRIGRINYVQVLEGQVVSAESRPIR